MTLKEHVEFGHYVFSVQAFKITQWHIGDILTNSLNVTYAKLSEY